MTSWTLLTSATFYQLKQCLNWAATTKFQISSKRATWCRKTQRSVMVQTSIVHGKGIHYVFYWPYQSLKEECINSLVVIHSRCVTMGFQCIDFPNTWQANHSPQHQAQDQLITWDARVKCDFLALYLVVPSRPCAFRRGEGWVSPLKAECIKPRYALLGQLSRSRAILHNLFACVPDVCTELTEAVVFMNLHVYVTSELYLIKRPPDVIQLNSIASKAAMRSLHSHWI